MTTIATFLAAVAVLAPHKPHHHPDKPPCRTEACDRRVWRHRQHRLPHDVRAMLARLRGCETRGIPYPRNYRAHTGNGYSGAYQFLPSTWHRAGGRQREAWQASPAEQDVRTVPVPPSLADMLRTTPARIDTPVMFPTPMGRLWRESNWRRTVWNPARDRVGLAGATPQGFRRSYISEMRAAGIDPADLAAIAGHGLAVANASYVRALGRSDERVRQAIG